MLISRVSTGFFSRYLFFTIFRFNVRRRLRKQRNRAKRRISHSSNWRKTEEGEIENEQV